MTGRDVLSMNTHDVVVELENNNIDPRAYSICGETDLPIDEQYVLNKSGNNGAVYYSQRGERLEQKIFEVEAEACRYFLNWLLQFPETRKSE